MKYLITLFLLLSASTLYAGERYVCSLNGSERVIEVVYLEQGQKVPCEVHYTKPESSEVLWTYKMEIGACESQAESFMHKQEGWGWSCVSESETVTTETSQE